MLFNITFIQTKIQEPLSFVMGRTDGTSRYLLIHFQTSVEITINGKTEITNPGAVIIFTPHFPQLFIPFASRLVHDYVDFELLDHNFLQDIRLPLNTIIYPRMSHQITNTIQKMKLVTEANEIGCKYENDNLFSTLLLTISRRTRHKRKVHEPGINSKTQEQFEELRVSLFNNPTNKTVASLANELSFSEPYFDRMYKKIFKISPSVDLAKARIEYAKAQLEQGASVQDISSSFGFSNVYYFYSWFKKKTGLTPKEYLKK